MNKTNKTTINHEEIKTRTESRNGIPSKVTGTNILRIDFPGYNGQEALEHISWEEFENNQLALVYQEKTAGGSESRFNKIVSRESVDAR